MSEDEDRFEDYDSQRVIDEEGDVDAQVKQRILDSRQAINENDNILFTQRWLQADIDINHEQAVVAWAQSVRRFIRDIEILLASDDIPESDFYYHDVELGMVPLYPPAKDGYDFTKFYTSDRGEDEIKAELDLPFEAEIPEPDVVEYSGLVDVIEKPIVHTRTWTILVESDGAMSEELTVSARAVADKEIYEQAIRHADQFLQKAGIGIKTGTPEVDDEETEPY